MQGSVQRESMSANESWGLNSRKAQPFGWCCGFKRCMANYKRSRSRYNFHAKQGKLKTLRTHRDGKAGK